jgi:hypothetical protein
MICTTRMPLLTLPNFLVVPAKAGTQGRPSALNTARTLMQTHREIAVILV